VNYSRYIPFIALTGDFIILNFLFVFGYYYLTVNAPGFTPQLLVFFIFLNITWFILVFVFGAHKIDRNMKKKSIFFTYVKIVVFFFFLFLLYFQVTPLSYYSRHYIKYLFPIFFASLISWKFILYFAFYFYRKRGYNYRNVIILGYTPLTLALQRYFITNKYHGYRFLGFFDEYKNMANQVIGQWNELKPFIENTHVDEIYLAWKGIPQSIMPEITAIISEYPIKVRIIPDLGNFSFKSAELISYGKLPVLQIHPGPLSYWYNRLIKRVFDLLLSLFMIIFILSWITLVLYIVSILGNRQGVFFRQRRTCSDGNEFSCIKFRTMRRNKDDSVRQTATDDERITPEGRILRKFSIDELPQFFNVLMGEMSVVGPRPHMLKHTAEYRQLIKQFMLRHTVKPGITGLAQVNGFRGEIRNLSDIQNRVENDVYYVENWSFNLDIKIIFLTIWVIIRGQKEAY
jgi:putative colanic acid biosysnthesis UDP-glucose lipid carrier transferase